MTTQPDPQQLAAEVQFWQVKYFELLIHSQQVITALNRPLIQQIQASQAAAQSAANGGNGTLKAAAHPK
jgi:hypothetical protein